MIEKEIWYILVKVVCICIHIKSQFETENVCPPKTFLDFFAKILLCTRLACLLDVSFFGTFLCSAPWNVSNPLFIERRQISKIPITFPEDDIHQYLKFFIVHSTWYGSQGLLSSKVRFKSGVLVVKNVKLVDADAIGESDDCVEVEVGVVNSISNNAFLWKKTFLQCVQVNVIMWEGKVRCIRF